MMRTFFLSILSALVLVSTIGCRKKADSKVLRLAHSLDVNHPAHKAMVFFGNRLKENSKGKMILKIYPSNQLGGERECLELLQIGSVDITKVSTAILENFVEEYKILGIPYLFRDKAHSHTVFDSELGNFFLSKGEEFRLKGLCFYDAGSRSFYTKERPVRHPDDLKGQKIRVQKSNMAVSMVQHLGGSPTPISWGELYTALQQGVVDGAENNLPSFYRSKHFEVCKYYSFDEHTSVPDVMLIAKETWDGLTEKEKEWVMQAAQESVVYQREAWAKDEEESLKAIQDAGVEISYPDKEPFTERTKPIIDEFRNDQNMMNMIENIRNLK